MKKVTEKFAGLEKKLYLCSGNKKQKVKQLKQNDYETHKQIQKIFAF